MVFKESQDSIILNFISGRDPTLIKVLLLFNYWVIIVINILVLMYTPVLFQDWPLFKYWSSFEPVWSCLHSILISYGRNVLLRMEIMRILTMCGRWGFWPCVEGGDSDIVWKVGILTLCGRWGFWHCVEDGDSGNVWKVGILTLCGRWGFWRGRWWFWHCEEGGDSDNVWKVGILQVKCKLLQDDLDLQWLGALHRSHLFLSFFIFLNFIYSDKYTCIGNGFVQYCVLFKYVFTIIFLL